MKRNEKKLIIILVAITIIMALIFIRQNKNKNQDGKGEQQPGQQTTEQIQYVQQNEDGTKQSTSEKLQETKQINDIEITNIQIKENGGKATLTATVKNNSSSTKKEFPVSIKLLNQAGETIKTLGAYVGTMKPGETRGIDASINMDISNIYDVSIEI